MIRPPVSSAAGTYVTVVQAGSDLAAVRPAGAVCVYWQFDNGIDPGTNNANIVNGLPGDLVFVAAPAEPTITLHAEPDGEGGTVLTMIADFDLPDIGTIHMDTTGVGSFAVDWYTEEFPPYAVLLVDQRSATWNLPENLGTISAWSGSVPASGVETDGTPIDCVVVFA